MPLEHRATLAGETDFEGFRAGFREALERMVRVNPPPGAPAGRDTPGSILDFLVIAIPPAAAVLATITNVLNLWLAGKVVRFSGRLTRPWPDLAAIDFPRPTGIIFLVAAGLTFVGGLVGYFATIASAAPKRSARVGLCPSTSQSHTSDAAM